MTATELTQEEALEAACHLLDDGHEVCGIKSAPPSHSWQMADLAGIHARWVKAKPGSYHSG